jgi:chromosome segregation protein
VHLKSLTLKGFKSFATPTTFTFEPGVTAVVGPNGSGKSNVVDALAWVMGEQGAKTLRGGKMEDVIFSGTDKKAPLGRAEVSLTIDNSDGALPIEYSEVTISRILFRNGNSEYSINGEEVRLLDVQELLSDSGLGREMHVIVGQGRLASILGASPEERRGFIEEAAGILKHRRRKEKSERKLEAMETNLTRLSDLATEVRRQLKPLGKQAEVAREASGIAAVVRDAKARLLADEAVQLTETIRLSASNEAERKAERTELAAKLATAQERLVELENDSVSSEVDRARNLAFAFDAEQERYRNLLSMANQKVALIGSQVSASEPQIDVVKLESDSEAALHQVAELSLAVAELRERLQAIESAKNNAKQALDDFDSEVAERVAAQAQFESELATLGSEMAIAESRLSTLKSSFDKQTEATEAAKARHAELQTELVALEKQFEASAPTDEGLKAGFEAASAKVQAASAAIESARDVIHKSERERDSLSAKRSALNLTLEQKDGTTLSAKLPGVRGLVASHLKIESGFEVAIAAALGSLADALVVDDRAAGLAAIEYLKKADGGRVDLIVADVESVGRPVKLPKVSGARLAVDVVTGPVGLLELLATVVVVDNLGAAAELYRADKSVLELTVITRDGDLLTKSVLRGGSASKPSKVELVAERDAAEKRLSEVNAALEKAKQELTEARANEESAKQAAAAALAALNQQDAELAERAELLGRLRVRIEASAAELARSESELETFAATVTEAEQKLAKAVAAHDAFAKSPKTVVSTAERATLEANFEQERQRDFDVRIELGSAGERLQAEQARADALRAQIDQINAAAEKARELAALHQRQLATASKVLALIPKVLDELAASGSLAKVTLHELEARRTAHGAELVQLRAEANETQTRLNVLTQSVHESELATHEAQLKLDNIQQRAHDELALTLEQLTGEYGPENPIVDPSDPSLSKPYQRAEQQRRLADAERLLERLGKVNPLALEEFNALEQRHKFLSDQLADLTATRKDLQQIINDLDDKMQQIFIAAYEDTKKAFESVLPILFPGGTGSLTLTDPDNLLTTGLEVAVKPAGKRIERLSLLSGGEKSLAAVAFLIAIFKARPSPFYVMDEVEAALDDANLGRLLTLLQELRTSSQLIIITHQKRTMEIADALYGVSMSGDGISAVVGQRLLETA